MARPRKNPLPETVAAENPVQEEKQKDDGLVTLNHFAKDGRMFLDGEVYVVSDYKVRVKPEHAQKAREHIRIGG